MTQEQAYSRPQLCVVHRGYSYLPDAVFDCRVLARIVQDISPCAALTWLELFRLSRGIGLPTVPVSIKDIVLSTGVSHRTVQKSISRLVKAGYIKIESEEPGQPRTYSVVWHL